MKMKAAFLTGIRTIEIRTTEAPRVERDTDVLIRVTAVGVCGSDVHYYKEGRIGDQIVSFPFVVGHEMCGVVESTGGGVTRVKPGDRIVVDPAISCHACSQCGKGRFHTCSALRFLGCPGQKEGCLAEYLVMPEESCYPIPDSMTDDDGVLCEPLSIGIYAWKLSAADRDAKAGILGAGPIGLSVLAAAIDSGTRSVYATDILDYRCAEALGIGAKWAGNPRKVSVPAEIKKRAPEGLDVVFECSGAQEALDQAVSLLAPGGRLMIVGIPSTERSSFPAHLARRLEISLVHVRRQNECVRDAIDLVNGRAGSYRGIVTHRFRLEETAAAFELVSGYSDGVIKAVIAI